MKNKGNVLYCLMIMLAGVVNFDVHAQQKNGARDAIETKDVSTSQGPNGIVRTIRQDRKGNIWTSSESSDDGRWVLSRYDEKSLTDKKPGITEITNKPMIVGILEDDKGNIWFGSFDGVYRYHGKTITDFKNAAGQK
jgi:hypothetical protein